MASPPMNAARTVLAAYAVLPKMWWSSRVKTTSNTSPVLPDRKNRTVIARRLRSAVLIGGMESGWTPAFWRVVEGSAF